MRFIRIVSFVGMVVSLLVLLVGWTTPNLLHVAVIGVPLQLFTMGLLWHLYKNHAIPLQIKADLQWLHHTSSAIHALMFLSILSFIFHIVIVALHLSQFSMFLIGTLGSLWLYVFAMSYGYLSWMSKNPQSKKRLHHTRTRLREKASLFKSDFNHGTTRPYQHQK